MTPTQKRNEIISILSFLQVHINNYVRQSFTDLTFDLEKLIESYLNVFEKPGEYYSNLNIQHNNYPAIDLENKSKNVAIQVTTNANSAKIKETLETYDKHNLKYSKLIIIGFVSATTKNYKQAEVYDSKFLIDLLRTANDEQLDELYEVLIRRIPLNALHPMDDKMCVEVVLNVINRSAVRDLTACEGDYDRMVSGLLEIKEIITTGVIKNKSIRAKSLVEYTEPIRERVREIEYDISTIIQICNKSKNQSPSHFICLSPENRDEIDELKMDIMRKSNSISDHFGLGIKIIGSNSYR